ncbi:hypothetical protein [Pseudonocardia hydrocarbonoxydans]|uniref:Uncharacterized protein n=1 Tax=Pseudonocardia hydrocarbonoxydans TaxID=76726 RepID=A0A4Y3WNZ4_9PSEU|nr:hypothetical protein [Pseudonocardia hydrocarbonoxydans]GEC20525.1 hypothetical protein PHY01_28080 [Pseudonocardia hydrocarbonoxydans]
MPDVAPPDPADRPEGGGATDDGPPDGAIPEDGPPAAPLPDAVRRRLAAVFGDALPDTTGDERDPAPDGNDARLLADRPPHHDR